MPEQPPLLVILTGPSAVGKMTIGQAMQRLTGIPLFYNHQIIDVLTNYFEFNSPPYLQVVESFYEEFMAATAKANRSLTITYGWAFNTEICADQIARYTRPFIESGGRVCVAELYAPLEVRLERNLTENRRAHKKTDWATVEYLTELTQKYQYRSNGDIGFDFEHLELDVTTIEPEESARVIAERFGLPVLGTG